jgi:hypothetical protein
MARGIVFARIGPGNTAVPVRLPKGDRTLSPRHVTALDNMDQRVSTSKGCVVAFFRGKGGKLVAAQRCEGRKLKAHNRKQCRGKKRQFIQCSRRR